jgi:tRNA threonylcarbamoyladenosine biosynthesis protein TsaB
MKLLALETANEQCSVSIVDETQELFFQLDTRAKAQTQTILPMIEQGFSQTKLGVENLTAIAFSRGPGSFSGVRINAAVTQALAWSNNVPVVPVSTLQALAQAAYRIEGLTEVTAILDARMNEVYIASFKLNDQQIMQAVDEEQLLNYENAQLAVRYPLVGSGATLVDPEQTQYKDLKATAQDIAIVARELAKQKQWVDAELALPVYLRDNAWKKIAEQGKKN